jgi:hypothetical protein
MSRKNTLETQLLGGISLRQERLDAIAAFLNEPYGEEGEARWLEAVEALISFNNDCSSVIQPKDAISTVIGTLPDGTVWYYTVSDKNTYENFLTKTIKENHNTRAAFMQAINNATGFGFETKISSSLKENKVESRSVMRLGATSSNIIGCIGLAYIL